MTLIRSRSVLFQVQGYCVAPKDAYVKVRCGRNHHGYLDRQCVICTACSTIFYNVSRNSLVRFNPWEIAFYFDLSVKFVKFYYCVSCAKLQAK